MNIKEDVLKALEFAIVVIENYQAEIRNSQELLGINLVEMGFCQGRVYLDVVPRLKEALKIHQQNQNKT